MSEALSNDTPHHGSLNVGYALALLAGQGVS